MQEQLGKVDKIHPVWWLCLIVYVYLYSVLELESRQKQWNTWAVITLHLHGLSWLNNCCYFSWVYLLWNIKPIMSLYLACLCNTIFTLAFQRTLKDWYLQSCFLQFHCNPSLTYFCIVFLIPELSFITQNRHVC